MCEKHSFVQDKAGKIYNGGGFEESHSMICRMHEIKEDSCNKYEWQPPHGYKGTDTLEGLTKDSIEFEEKSSHLDAIERYLEKLFPTVQSFDQYFLDESWHGKQVGNTVYSVCDRKLNVEEGLTCFIAGASCDIRGYNVQVYGGNVTMEGEIRVSGNSKVDVTGSFNVIMSGSGDLDVGLLSKVQVDGRVAIRLRDGAKGYVTGNCRVHATDNSMCEVKDGVFVSAHQGAKVIARNKSICIAHDDTQVTAFDEAMVIKRSQAYGNNTSHITTLNDAVLVDIMGLPDSNFGHVAKVEAPHELQTEPPRQVFPTIQFTGGTFQLATCPPTKPIVVLDDCERDDCKPSPCKTDDCGCSVGSDA